MGINQPQRPNDIGHQFWLLSLYVIIISSVVFVDNVHCFSSQSFSSYGITRKRAAYYNSHHLDMMRRSHKKLSVLAAGRRQIQPRHGRNKLYEFQERSSGASSLLRPLSPAYHHHRLVDLNSIFRERQVQLFSTASNVIETTDEADSGLERNNVDQNDTIGYPLREMNADSINGHEEQGGGVSSKNVFYSEKEGLSVEEYLMRENISSRPVEGGTWNVKDPLGWSNNFGRRSIEDEERLNDLVRLKPGDEGYFDASDIKKPKATIVRNREDALTVLERLNAADPAIFHACDTEVMDVDLKKVGPVGNGYVTCFSMYSGPDFDYGLGDGPGTALWIDNLDDACGVLQIFKDWLENPRFLKVWHNYGFDRHVLWNEGILVKGFGGDTMHMARLQDTSRLKMGKGTATGYSLEALTEDLLKKRKKPMKEIFGVKRKRKDGSDGAIVDIPPIETLQRDPRWRSEFIWYSCYDAMGTWYIRKVLMNKLQDMKWFRDKNLYDYYIQHMRPFGEVLTDMERRGIRVDARNYLRNVEIQARKDRAHHSKVFRDWTATKIGPDGLALNPSSSLQLGTFLFGGAYNEKTGEHTETVRVFKVPREELEQDALLAYQKRDELEAQNKKGSSADEEGDQLDLLLSSQLKTLCKERGLKCNGKKEELKERLRQHYLDPTAAAEKVNKGPRAKRIDELDQMKVAELKAACKEIGLKASGKKAELKERLVEHILKHYPEDPEDGEKGSDGNEDGLAGMSDEDLRHSLRGRGLPTMGTRQELLERLQGDIQFANRIVNEKDPASMDDCVAISEVLERAAKKDGGALAEYLEEVKIKTATPSKYVEVKVTSLGLEPETATAGGAPSVTAAVLKKLAGDPFADPPRYGTAFDTVGKDGCEALFSLVSIGSIDTMITNFLTSLQELADEDSRVHCSLNLNTETGRLSSRRPNLQNQPALEKDTYQIRKAFQSSPGNNLIVADYGQLELRLLASMTHCESMINAFKSGGDFHSRTAVDMFDYVKNAVDSGEVLLEWDYSKGESPKPLVKDKFASERRKAKTLNFSIAYGKTAHGLSLDWGVSSTEAQEMLDAWYAARPEVLEWQQDTKQYAREKGVTRTLMGRYRQLPEAMGKNRKLLGHAERASINTPIQGGAADVAMMAMIKINDSEKLKKLGWILLLQIHDEVILEGPEETAAEAFEEVLQCMQEPWVYGLKKTDVPLVVDGSWEQKTWYDAK